MVEDILRIGIQALLITGFLVAPERHARYLLSRRGRGWLALYLAVVYAAAVYCFAPHRGAFGNALISLFYPSVYLASFHFFDRRQRRKTGEGDASATRDVTAADRPASPPGPAP